MGEQTTASEAGAPINEAHEWKSINWKAVQKQVRRLQMRIAKAVLENSRAAPNKGCFKDA